MIHRRFPSPVVFAALATVCFVAVAGTNGCGGTDPSSSLFPADGGVDAAPDGQAGDDGGADASDSGKPCPQLRREIEQWGRLARACNPRGRNECGVRLEYICCSISVTDPESEEVQNFLKAMKEYKENDRCWEACFERICDGEASHTCESSNQSEGQCKL